MSSIVYDQHTQFGSGPTDYQALSVPIHSGEPSDDFDETNDDGHKKTGIIGSIFSYTCTCVGVGVLSNPGAFQQVGWFGVVVILVLGLVSAQTGRYLIACQFAKPGVLLRTYEDIGAQAMSQCSSLFNHRYTSDQWASFGRLLVGFFQSITLFGVCTIFLILIGANMNALVDALTLHDWVFLFGGLLIPVAWIKTMNEITYLAIFGVLASLYVAGLVVVKGFIRASDAHHGEIDYDFFKIGGFAQSINILAFSLGGHSVLPNIAAHLREPKKNHVKFIFSSYGVITFIYSIVAIGGYAGWGTLTKSKVLDNMDLNEGSVKFAFAAITAHVVMAYPIPLNPLSLALERMLGIDKKEGASELISRILTRTCLVLATIFVASVVPYFGDILNLVSSLSIVVVAFILPPLFYYLLYRHTQPFSIASLALMITIAIGGVATSVVGIYYSISGLVSDLKGPSPWSHFFKP